MVQKYFPPFWCKNISPPLGVKFTNPPDIGSDFRYGVSPHGKCTGHAESRRVGVAACCCWLLSALFVHFYHQKSPLPSLLLGLICDSLSSFIQFLSWMP